MSWADLKGTVLDRSIDKYTLPAASNIFQNLAFKEATSDDDLPVPAPASRTEGYLRYPVYRSQDQAIAQDLIVNHVIAQRSFAVFPRCLESARSFLVLKNHRSTSSTRMVLLCRMSIVHGLTSG